MSGSESIVNVTPVDSGSVIEGLRMVAKRLQKGQVLDAYTEEELVAELARRKSHR